MKHFRIGKLCKLIKVRYWLDYTLYKPSEY